MINIKIGVAELLQLSTSDNNNTMQNQRLSGLFDQLLQNGLDSSLELPKIVETFEVRADKEVEDLKFNELFTSDLAPLLFGIDLKINQEKIESNLENEEVTEYLTGSFEFENMTKNDLFGQAPIVTDSGQDTNQEKVQTRPQALPLGSEAITKKTVTKENESKQILPDNQKTTFFNADLQRIEDSIIKEPMLEKVPLRNPYTRADKPSKPHKSLTVTGENHIEGLKFVQNTKLVSSGQEVISQQFPANIPREIFRGVRREHSLNQDVPALHLADSAELDLHATNLFETSKPEIVIFNSKHEPIFFDSIANQMLNDKNQQSESDESQVESDLQGYRPNLKSSSSISDDFVKESFKQSKNEDVHNITRDIPEQEISNPKQIETAVLSEVVTDSLSQSSAKVLPEVQSVPSQTSPQQLEFQEEVVEQIVDRMVFNLEQEHQEVRIQLKPDYLGEVSIKVAIERGIVRAEFVAENQAVKEIIAASLPQLRVNMEQAGIQLGDVNVNLGNDQDSTNSRNSQQQFSKHLVENHETTKFMEEPNLLDGHSQINLRA